MMLSSAAIMTVLPDSLVDEVARRFALLGDPTRLRVVRTIHDVGESTVQEIAEATGTSVANASQHLARLRADPTIEALCATVCESIRQRAQALTA
jgi:DNA-binding transcriptional ArsR family regulator